MSRFVFLIAVTLGGAVPVAAQPQPIEVDPQADWVHEPTGLNFPARINRLVRDRIVSYQAGENNIGSTYFSADDSEILSIYVYRSGSYDVSMMADAAISAISTNDHLGTIDREQALFSTFGDAAIGPQSGVLTTFPVDGAYRATGLALFRSGNWLIKLRLSSKQVDAPTLDKQLNLLASGLPLTPPAQPAPPAYRIEDCGDVRPRPEAGRRDLTIGDWLMATTAVSLSYDESTKEIEKAAASDHPGDHLCRDRQSKPGRMYYRLSGTGDPRAIVFGDSGTVATVRSTGISLDEGALPPIVLSLGNGLRTQFYQGFDSIPGFGQMLEVLQNGKVEASVERSDEGSKITLPSIE